MEITYSFRTEALKISQSRLLIGFLLHILLNEVKLRQEVFIYVSLLYHIVNDSAVMNFISVVNWKLFKGLDTFEFELITEN